MTNSHLNRKSDVIYAALGANERDIVDKIKLPWLRRLLIRFVGVKLRLQFTVYRLAAISDASANRIGAVYHEWNTLFSITICGDNSCTASYIDVGYYIVRYRYNETAHTFTGVPP